ncbi:PP2C family serine/threonine-protein phosphatase [Actinoallomurus sp. NPDC050550]|uniref:PP2C family protein-serine/threonine phosphatase n=1 Tax=Actinoallomurus sp. NPDC050550 TaxID=3154937 RepID=UPI00340DF07A
MGAPESCPGCGSEVFADEAFCQACGRSLTGEPTPTGAACAACGSAAFSADGYCEQCGVLRPGDRDHVEMEAGGAAGVTDRGLRHSRNEDAMALAVAGESVAAVVCDGVSTSPLPQAASQAAADTGLKTLTERLAAGDDPETATRTALTKAVEAVTALAQSPHDAPACTYVSACAGPGGVTVGWVGDSRAYWLAGDASRQLTADDSWAAEMVAHGALTEAEAQAHPNAHAIVAWLGADAGEVEQHVTAFVPEGPGTLLLCSDGLWNYYPEATRLASVMPSADPLTAARHLVRLAVDAGGRDNITVVVIPFTQEHAQ